MNKTYPVQDEFIGNSDDEAQVIYQTILIDTLERLDELSSKTMNVIFKQKSQLKYKQYKEDCNANNSNFYNALCDRDKSTFNRYLKSVSKHK